MNVIFEQLAGQPGGVTVMDSSILVESEEPNQPPTRKQVRVEVLSVDLKKEEMQIRLIVRSSPDTNPLVTVFTVGQFDFPMIDYLRLRDGLRCAIVLNVFDLDYADFTFVYFHGARSMKETEVLYDLRKPE